MRAALSLVPIALAVGCAQTIVVTEDEDAGQTPPVRDAGVARDGGTGDRDGGSTLDAAGAGDAGGADPDGGSNEPPEITWGQMSLPANAAAVAALWGRPGTHLYSGSSRGELLAFDAVNGWDEVWQEPSNHGIRAIGGTASTLFVASESALHVFANDDFSSPQSFSIARTRSIEGMAVKSDTDVYLVATLFDGRGFYRFDGVQITPIAEPTTLSTLASVAAFEGGPVFVGGNGHMFRYEAATLTEETVEWPSGWEQIDILMFTFFGIGRVDGRVVAGGSGHMIFERGDDGAWRPVYAPGYSDAIRAFAGAYAVGEAGPSGPIVRRAHGTWEPAGFDMPFDLLCVWAEDAETYYAGGFVSNGLDGVILRGSAR